MSPADEGAKLASREFPVRGEGTMTLYQVAPESPSLWEGYCSTCGCMQRRYTCYRCGNEIEDPPSIRLQPPYGSLDSRSDNWLCPPCLIEFQKWAKASPAIITNTDLIFNSGVIQKK